MAPLFCDLPWESEVDRYMEQWARSGLPFILTGRSGCGLTTYLTRYTRSRLGREAVVARMSRQPDPHAVLRGLISSITGDPSRVPQNWEQHCYQLTLERLAASVTSRSVSALILHDALRAGPRVVEAILDLHEELQLMTDPMPLLLTGPDTAPGLSREYMDSGSRVSGVIRIPQLNYDDAVRILEFWLPRQMADFLIDYRSPDAGVERKANITAACLVSQIGATIRALRNFALSWQNRFPEMPFSRGLIRDVQEQFADAPRVDDAQAELGLVG